MVICIITGMVHVHSLLREDAITNCTIIMTNKIHRVELIITKFSYVLLLL